jgi:hypothetical protein
MKKLLDPRNTVTVKIDNVRPESWITERYESPVTTHLRASADYLSTFSRPLGKVGRAVQEDVAKNITPDARFRER